MTRDCALGWGICSNGFLRQGGFDGSSPENVTHAAHAANLFGSAREGHRRFIIRIVGLWTSLSPHDLLNEVVFLGKMKITVTKTEVHRTVWKVRHAFPLKIHTRNQWLCVVAPSDQRVLAEQQSTHWCYLKCYCLCSIRQLVNTLLILMGSKKNDTKTLRHVDLVDRRDCLFYSCGYQTSYWMAVASSNKYITLHSKPVICGWRVTLAAVNRTIIVMTCPPNTLCLSLVHA